MGKLIQNKSGLMVYLPQEVVYHTGWTKDTQVMVSVNQQNINQIIIENLDPIEIPADNESKSDFPFDTTIFHQKDGSEQSVKTLIPLRREHRYSKEGTFKGTLYFFSDGKRLYVKRSQLLKL